MSRVSGEYVFVPVQLGMRSRAHPEQICSRVDINVRIRESMRSVMQHGSGGLIVILSVMLGWMSGCSAGIGTDCEVDSDCGGAQVCANSQCTRTCTRDDDCRRSGYACRPLDDPEREGQVNVCVTTDTGTDIDLGSECSSDEECRERLGPNAECGIDARCIVEYPREGLLIRDRSDLAGQSGGDDRYGAEIGAVYLADDDGAPVGFARTVDYAPGGDLGGDSHLDGAAPALTDDRQCVTEPLAERTTPLGGGDLLVEFVDEAGEILEIAPDQQVVVIEWAEANCGNSADDSDTYDVSFCESESGRLELEDCTEQLTSSTSGRTVVTPRPTDSSDPDAGRWQDADAGQPGDADAN